MSIERKMLLYDATIRRVVRKIYKSIQKFLTLKFTLRAIIQFLSVCTIHKVIITIISGNRLIGLTFNKNFVEQTEMKFICYFLIFIFIFITIEIEKSFLYDRSRYS